jgi:hypothetical protein
MMPEALSPVCQFEGDSWRVLLSDRQWHACRNELDARFIAHGLQLADAVRRGEPADDETADELEEAAAALVRNVGACQAEQMIRTAANLARANASRR